ncbi:MAG: invasion associated locus B family protein [Hyphomicrobiales bacterium]|nr:invasion associated locus B family protein [Hyphomicrobiales bacterium]
MANSKRVMGGRGGAGLAAALALVMLAGGTAMAQDTTSDSGDTAAAENGGAIPGTGKNWIKVCGEDPKVKKKVCVVAQEIRADTGQFLASTAIREIEGEKKKVLAVFTPTIMLLQPGLRVQIDKNKQIAGKYAICFPDRCYAEIEISADVVEQMKRGNEITITTLNQQARGVNFKLTLSGFTAAYDGPPEDPKELEAQQKKLQTELQKRAEQARKRLLEQQSQDGMTGGGEPAPAQ